MCGLFCHVCQKSNMNESTTNCDGLDQWSSLESTISRRGPDCLSTNFQSLNDIWNAEFAASVLWMQGTDRVKQPSHDEEGNILLWNGDIFDGPLATDDTCDTLEVLQKFRSNPNNILEILSLVRGPYSFIYFQKQTNLLYFGRDRIGRHSLLIKIEKDCENPFFILCSVANKNINGIKEVPAIGIFSIDLNRPNINLSCYPWYNQTDRISMISYSLYLSIKIQINRSILGNQKNCKIEQFPISTEDIKFSKMVVDELDSDIVNNEYIMKILLADSEISDRVFELWKLLKKSINVRIHKKPKYCQKCVQLLLKRKSNEYHSNDCNTVGVSCDHAKIGLLFSGGLDSTILAAMAHEFVPQHEPIDLMNVAFEKKEIVKPSTSVNKKNQNMKHLENDYFHEKFDVPDRKTGLQALEELKKNFPERQWNFIKINITREELREHCKERICHIIYPLKTILDESLGCAVWFGSRGVGILSSTNEPYTSPCRVLLLGMGADELFGGYARHRSILRRSGWPSLNEELNSELFRISERNLGRDDRVVSDHGRQSRLPFLDEDVVEYVQNLKPWERCCPIDKMPSGLGDKLLLRLLAYHLGLKTTSSFPKRAFQFGSRIANSKENATDLSIWLT